MDGKTAITRGVNSKPSIKERQRAQREEAILDSAVKLIAERGFASVTFEQIADEACVSKPTLYQHFRSKDDLAMHLSLRCMNLVRDRVLSVPSDMPVGVRLRQVMRTVVEFRLDKRLSLYADLAQHVLPIRHGIPEINQIETELIGQLESMIDEAQTQGIVRSDLSASFMCQILVSIFKDQTYVDPSATLETAEIFTAEIFTLLGMPALD
jgi:AcrR family transcriptional regulator